MLGQWFYHKRIRTAVSIFGSMFNNLYVLRHNNAGETISQVKVPLSYAPKRNFISRLKEMDNGEENERRVAIKLPRMSFEITSMVYDAARQLPKLNTISKTLGSDLTKRNKLYTATPYTIGFDLNVYAKSQDDALQIVEQIIPYFQPDYTVTMKMIDELTDYRDVPIILESVDFDDSYEGGYDERRVITYNLSFKMQLYFFGPVYQGKIIREVIERDYIGDGNDAFTSTEIDAAGLVKEVKHYEPAFSAVSNAVSGSTTVTFPTAINSSISANDEVFGTNLSTNPTVSSIAEDKQSIVVSSAVTIDANTTLKFVGSVDANDTFVIAETVSFYDDGAGSTFTEDKVTDAS